MVYSEYMGVGSTPEDAMAPATAKAGLSLSESIKTADHAAKGLPTTISTRVRTLNGERLKVNEKMGNPIEIATVVVRHVADTANALFDVDDYQSYVAMQAETALRHVASSYARDHLEDESDAAGGTIELDDERKAQMASNLMVILCGESKAHPVLNEGFPY